MKRKVCVVITARPSYARIKTALAAIREHPELELQLVLAASALLERYGSVVDVIEADGFKVDRRVHMILEGENLVTSAKSTGLGLVELATVFDDLKPDMVVTIADRFETLATAVCASYMNIPLVHIQGGEITGSIDDKVRHATTKLADLHLVASRNAAERLARMGEEPERVVVTGCPSIDIARACVENGRAAPDAFEFGGVGARFDLSEGFLVVMQHPVTTEYEAARQQVGQTLEAIDRLDRPTLWFWPNVDAGSDGTSKCIRAYRERHVLPHVHFFKNLPPETFLRLLKKAQCIVGNSSVAIRECAYLGVPAVNIGTRQNGRDRGPNVIDVGHDTQAIESAIELQCSRGPYPSSDLYGDGQASRRIADALSAAVLSIDKRLTI
jgi:UDP-hydrolysing UDP-N-acetyl-D-glucosamine 2-epimerase